MTWKNGPLQDPGLFLGSFRQLSTIANPVTGSDESARATRKEYPWRRRAFDNSPCLHLDLSATWNLLTACRAPATGRQDYTDQLQTRRRYPKERSTTYHSDLLALRLRTDSIDREDCAIRAASAKLQRPKPSPP